MGEVPALAMIRQPPRRSARARKRWWRGARSARRKSSPGESVIGGGATPEQSIPTWLIAIECPVAADAASRRGPAVLRAHRKRSAGRSRTVEEKRVLLDLRKGIRKKNDRSLFAAPNAGRPNFRLRAFLIGAFRGIDADLFAFGDEGRHLHHQAGFELGGLVTLETEAPFMPGSVSTTVRSTVAGSSTLIGLPS
jgi:hypothetical protein